MTNYLLTAALSIPLSLNLYGQNDSKQQKISFHGNIQSDILAFPQEDHKIGTGLYDNKFMTNTYVEFSMNSKFLETGLRFEYMNQPLPGFEPDFKGWGLPHFYVKGNYKRAELTLGDFYDQFGSGILLRAYEERSLGIDNSLRGGRLVLKPCKGVNLKLLGGQQRYYWHHRNLDSSSSWTYGGDIELNLDRWIKRMKDNATFVTLGFSVINNHAGNEESLIVTRPDKVSSQFENQGREMNSYRLVMPSDVTAFDVRANLQKGNYNLLAEYAWKTQDPSSTNNYTYNQGQTLLLSGSYSKSGMSILLQAKRSEDMAFRSRRMIDKGSNACYINHLPAFTMQHTYALASLYPYATQMSPGEWAFQTEFGYSFKRRTLIGGKYGMNVKVNFSHVRGIEQESDLLHQNQVGYDAPKSRFFHFGSETYFQDINVLIEKKISRTFKMNLMYANQLYNQDVVEGHGSKAIKSHILVAEGNYKISKKMTLRGEAQYLHTCQDQKDWWFGLLELSILPHFMFTISDQYNGHVPSYTADGAIDDSKGTNEVHYLMGAITYTHQAHRLQLSYGKTRSGYNCAGGVCRYVPASKGLLASYSFNF